jgi:hypothetical protein
MARPAIAAAQHVQISILDIGAPDLRKISRMRAWLKQGGRSHSHGIALPNSFPGLDVSYAQS